MTMTQVHRIEEERLLDLWRRRATLSEPEWYELYALVNSTLSNRGLDLIARLGGTHEEYIQDFFEDKVLMLSQHNQELYHRGALIFYYERYLISRLRDPYLKHGLAPMEDNEEQSAVDRGDSHEDEAAMRQQLSDWLAIELGPSLGTETGSDIRELITDFFGVDLEHVLTAARDFLHGRGAWSHLAADSGWIQLYLGCHFCLDGEMSRSISLNTLARRHGIPSYHSRAVKLGITVPKQQDAALVAFRKSYRGQWLLSLGIEVDPEHQLEMALALKILCLVALKEQEPC
ncbi:hypothetical protein [Thiocapsa imhoffii]|nr:hypothetical protein [Thiocapsa imhoffii]